MSILERLRLPEKPRIVFERNYLALAVCQVRFPAILDIANQSYVANFQRAIRTTYPYLNRIQVVQTEIRPGADIVTSQTAPWRFADKDGIWTVVLAQDFLALDTRQYETFEDFLERLEIVLDALVTCFEPSVATRIGLRYINEIRDIDADWPEAINRDLLGPLFVEELREHTTQAVQQIVLNLGDANIAAIQHGLLPSGSTVQPRNGEQMPASPFYLLDFDMSCTFAAPSLCEMNPAHICMRVGEYHEVIERLFRWAITDEFTQRLGVRQQ